MIMVPDAGCSACTVAMRPCLALHSLALNHRFSDAVGPCTRPCVLDKLIMIGSQCSMRNISVIGVLCLPKDVMLVRALKKNMEDEEKENKTLR